MEERPVRRPRQGGRRPKRKVCAFCADKNAVIDYKDTNRLRRYVSERGKILPRRMTGTCAKHQRELAIAIKRDVYKRQLVYIASPALYNK